MNKNFKYIAAAFGVLLLGFSSCGDRLSEAVVKGNVSVEEGTDILSFNLEEVSPTRLTLIEDSNNYKQVWTKGDAISVIGTGKAKFTLKEESAGTKRGIFTGSYESAGESPYHIVFPYDENAFVSDGAVHFAIPQVKTGVAGNVAPGAMPCVALAGDTEDGTPEIKNVMGLLRLTFKSESEVSVSKMTLHDLGGNMLWGNCSVPVENGALAVDKMTLSDGGNSISLVWAGNDEVSISSTETDFFFPVPPGSLDRGFSIVIYDNTGKAYTFIQKVSNPVAAERAKAVAISSSSLSEKSEPKDPKARGYYKSLFVDAGLYLNPRFYAENHGGLSVIPAIKALGLENDYEYFAATPTSFKADFSVMLETNKKAQRSVFVGTPLPDDGFEGISWKDANGVLLYPDGAPRFRMMYSNGGKSGDHGKTMTEEGCFRVHDFYTNGGSYVGTCAGTIIACTSYNGSVRYRGPEGTYSYGIWPGNAAPTGMPYTLDLDAVYTGMKVTSNVLADYGFNQNGFINDFEHHGGCYLPTDDCPYPYEQLLTYQYNKDEGSTVDDRHRYKQANSSEPWFRYNGTGNFINIVDKVSTWAYKADNTSGRAFLCGSHPEKATEGDKLEFTKAMFLYAMDGNGDARVKQGNLKLGDVRVMDKSTGDGQPDYTKIGDGQYHHFKFISSGIENFQLVLSSNYTSDSGINLYLSLRQDGLAWLSDADYVICTKGSNKILSIKNLPEGEWYVGVYCATKVIAVATSTDTPGVDSKYPRYFKYSGKTAVLNGIPYTISINSGENTVPSYPALPFDNNLSLDD